MGTGAITEQIDVALLAFNLFFLFFIGLVAYLHREGKREGYPLLSDLDNTTSTGWFGMPAAKTFKLWDGSTFTAPDARDANAAPLKAVAMPGGFGSPIEPTGNPMLDGIGPGAYSMRRDIPDVTFEGLDRIVPMRVAPAFHIPSCDTDIRGWAVTGCDGVQGAVVREIWVDRSESVIRYLELEAPATSTGNGAAGTPAATVLVPMNMVDMDRSARTLNVPAVLGHQIAGAPKLKSPDKITLLEEERIMAYYGAGYLYATPQRQEPLL